MTRLTLILALLLLPAALFADDHFQEQIDKLVERVGVLEEENAELKRKDIEGEIKDDE